MGLLLSIAGFGLALMSQNLYVIAFCGVCLLVSTALEIASQ